MMKSLSARLLRSLSLETRGPHRNHARTSDHDHHPSPSLVLLPAHVTGQSIKVRLPLVMYGELLEKKTRGAKEDGVCIVCMEVLEGRDMVREQGNCGHVFHGDCLDAWIDRDHDACPLCRARLLPSDNNEGGGGVYDPWRAERMVYLFGEDCSF